MRILYFLIFVMLVNCNKETKKEINNEEFICIQKDKANRFFFKRMKNFSSFKNKSTNKMISKKIDIGYKDKDGRHRGFLFEIGIIDDFINVEEIEFKNDSLFLHQTNGDYSCLFAFNENFLNNNISFGTQGKFTYKYYDKRCNDTIYVFNYSYFIEDKGLSEEKLEKIYASKQRGILKIVFKDSAGDIWEGKYYPELDTPKE